MRKTLCSACLYLLAGCGGTSSPPAADMTTGPSADMTTTSGDMAFTPPDETQGPPALSAAAIEAWLQKGLYKSWKCEPNPVMNRRSAHGATNRICQNRAQAEAAGAPFPVGAASVKELFDGAGRPNGHAFAIRTAAGEGGQGRYWYEKIGSSLITSSQGPPLCTGCHSSAPTDYTYELVK